MFLFLYLKAFDSTGGIEKFCRSMMKALELRKASEQEEEIIILSAYDTMPDKKYHSGVDYKGFGKNRIAFSIECILVGLKANKVLIAHINLAFLGCLLKWLRPSIKLISVTHGIEVWGKLSWIKKKLLCMSDEVLAVSQYTKNILIEKHQIPIQKIKIFRNTLDPYFSANSDPKRIKQIKRDLNIPHNAKVLLTIARLKTYEKSKGYDKVIQSLPKLLDEYPTLHYILAGKYSQAEHKRILELIQLLGLQNHVHIPGFIDDQDLPNYYSLADAYVMPSTKEGFGIVFIEAMACGTPAIAGNKDGSSDAILCNELGCLIDPDDYRQIQNAIRFWLNKGKDSAQQASHLIWDTYGFSVFCQNVKQL
jgi:phosphatidylinositol alpha-1,6-mannosyltransferase